MKAERLNEIESKLSRPVSGDSLTDLFCETLLWGRPVDTEPIEFHAGYPLQKVIQIIPVAQIGNFPVFMVRWDKETLLNKVLNMFVANLKFVNINPEIFLIKLTRRVITWILSALEALRVYELH